MRFELADIGPPLAGADVGPDVTVRNPSASAPVPEPVAIPTALPSPEGCSIGALGLRRFIGGGRFLAPPAVAPGLFAGGGARNGTGSGSCGIGGWAETSSWSDLKLRFERIRFIVWYSFFFFMHKKGIRCRKKNIII
jgi:hypothetical protein